MYFSDKIEAKRDAQSEIALQLPAAGQERLLLNFNIKSFCFWKVKKKWTNVVASDIGQTNAPQNYFTFIYSQNLI